MAVTPCMAMAAHRMQSLSTDTTQKPTSVIHHSYMASAWLRQQAASSAKLALIAGAGHSAAARSKCVAASMSSAAERGPASQAGDCPHSTVARIRLACRSSGAALTTLADSALSLSSFHHSCASGGCSFARASRVPDFFCGLYPSLVGQASFRKGKRQQTRGACTS